MPTNFKITYTNHSVNKDLPKVFIFTKPPTTPSFDELKDSVAWKVVPDIGKSNTIPFTFPITKMVNQKTELPVAMAKSEIIDIKQERKEPLDEAVLNCPSCNYPIKFTIQSLLAGHKITCPSCSLEMRADVPSSIKEHL